MIARVVLSILRFGAKELSNVSGTLASQTCTALAINHLILASRFKSWRCAFSIAVNSHRSLVAQKHFLGDAASLVRSLTSD